MKQIDCIEVANGMKSNVKKQIFDFKEAFHKDPTLVIIRVGDDPASKVYIRNKVKVCEEVGIKTLINEFPADIKESFLLEVITQYNHDPNIHGIIVQLPLPEHIDEKTVCQLVDTEKDVDGFHPHNIGELQSSGYIESSLFLPATAYGIKYLLTNRTKELKGKDAVVIGRSDIVGQPVAQLLLKMDMTVTICHSHSLYLIDHLKTADVVVAAAGVPGLINCNMLKPGAIVIDVGINRDENGKLCGDFDPTGSEEFEGYYTPVPNGVGRLTTAAVAAKTLFSAWGVELNNKGE